MIITPQQMLNEVFKSDEIFILKGDQLKKYILKFRFLTSEDEEMIDENEEYFVAWDEEDNIIYRPRNNLFQFQKEEK